MKRTLFTLTFLATFGMALAGPPVDYQLVCGTDEDAPLVGVASLVEGQLHVALIDGALEACLDGVYGLADGATAFTVSYTLEDGVVTDVQVAFDAEPESVPPLTYAEVPQVAVEGKLGAQQNRAAARERASEARARADERVTGPPMDVPRGGDDGDEEEAEAEADETVDDGKKGNGPPSDLPAPANRGRR